MKVPFRLVPRARSEPAVAAIFPGGRVAEAIEACARRGLSPWGRVFATADGLLVKFGCRVDGPIPGAVRLRALAEDLMIPVDADLLPALLDDEVHGLTRDRGLVGLPGGRFLTYDSSAPVEPRRLLATAARRQGGWTRFPEPEPLSDRIQSIELALDDPFQTAAFETLPGAEGAGTADDPTKPGSPADQALGRASLGLGRGMIWLGKTLGIRSIAEQGARWVKQAVERAPRLSEAVLGRQSAAIQALLKEFREGDPERALGKALPIGGDHHGRGASPSIGDRLADQDTRYSLASLLGGRGDGGSGYWLGTDDLVAALAREYRKAADAARKAGDFRRAAYIYGRLLQDFRWAASALQAGGLHRDAAMVYLKRLDDRQSAARAFEAAGDLDRALTLYQGLNDHVAAAELLRRMGEEDSAIRHFERAARELAPCHGGLLAAGNLMLDRAGRADLALGYFAEGWRHRLTPGRLTCALRILQIRTARGEHGEFLKTLHEAGEFVQGNELEAPRFFNQIMGFCPGLPESVADEVRDRARLGLAVALRARLASGQRTGATVSELFGQQPHWDRGLVADADLAARRESRQPDRPPAAPALPAALRIGTGLVTAVAAGTRSGDLFLGFDNGDLFVIRAGSGMSARIAEGSHAIASLATDPDGAWVVAVQAGRSRSGRTRRGRIDAYERGRDGLYQSRAGFAVDELANPWLTAVRRWGLGWLVGLWDGQGLYFLDLPGLSERGVLLRATEGWDGPTAGILLPKSPEQPEPAILWHDGQGWAVAALPEYPHHDLDSDTLVAIDPHQPQATSNSTLRSTWLGHLWTGPTALQLLWRCEDGLVHWRAIDLRDRQTDQPHHRLSTDDGGYRHAALVRDGLVAALARDQVEWVRIGPMDIHVLLKTPINLFHPVACFVVEAGRILVVVGAGGDVARLRIPPL